MPSYVEGAVQIQNVLNLSAHMERFSALIDSSGVHALWNFKTATPTMFSPGASGSVPGVIDTAESWQRFKTNTLEPFGRPFSRANFAAFETLCVQRKTGTKVEAMLVKGKCMRQGLVAKITAALILKMGTYKTTILQTYRK